MAYTTIDDPSAHFQTAIYTGTGSSQTVTNDGNSDLKPDWIWIKCRSNARDHVLLDSTRGGTKALTSNTNGAEATDGAITAFNTDGFTHSGQNAYGGSSETHVAWQWKANGGTTSSNSNGSITSTVQANTTAGFSIVTYTSAAGGQTIGHGLGVKPDMYIIKERTTSGDDWFVYHSALGEGKKIRLNGTGAAESDTNIWQNTAPTTTVAYLQNDGGGVNQNTGGNQNYIGYFFNSVKGYSKFGSYTGNGNADGTFVYTGFKPKYLLQRRTNASGQGWTIQNPDNQSYNLINNYFFAQHSGSTFTGYAQIDFLSNGFKIRTADAQTNGSGDTYIYMAFAEHPFVSSEGVPVTAR